MAPEPCNNTYCLTKKKPINYSSGWLPACLPFYMYRICHEGGYNRSRNRYKTLIRSSDNNDLFRPKSQTDKRKSLQFNLM